MYVVLYDEIERWFSKPVTKIYDQPFLSKETAISTATALNRTGYVNVRVCELTVVYQPED